MEYPVRSRTFGSFLIVNSKKPPNIYFLSLSRITYAFKRKKGHARSKSGLE